MQKLLGTPHMPPFALFEKIQFLEDLGMASGTLWKGPLGPGEVKTEKVSKFLKGLSTRWGHPTCRLLLCLKNQFLEAKGNQVPGAG